MATIVLRDLPKLRVGLDMHDFRIEGGFRGFQGVIDGYHQLRVWESADADPVRAAVYLPRPGAVAVLIYAEGALGRDDSDDGRRLADLAATGAMNRALIDATGGDRIGHCLAWRRATSAIDADAIDDVDVSVPTGGENRFRGLYAVHGEGLLRVVQVAFARLVRDGDLAPLRALLAAHDNGGERGVMMAASYLPRFVDAFAAMRTLVPALRGVSLAYLVEDMADVGRETGNAELVAASQELAQ